MKQRDLESKENWITARIDELLDDDEWLKKMEDEHGFARATDYKFMHYTATEQATREHAELEHFLLEDKINMMEIG